MSSTNRGSKRNKYDYYITPVDEIEKFIHAVKEVIPNIFEMDRILDPCAGGDKDNGMSYPVAIYKSVDEYIDLTTVDIREDSRAEYKVDYFDFKPDKPPHVIITKPPFDIALKVIKKALEDVQNNGYVIMLLRLNFFGSEKRNKWLLENMPKYCFVHSKRMSFTQNGGTDSIEYAHFIWQKGVTSKHTETHLLKYR